jgi:DNA repair exonuclease SbcCD ATPase subunit
MKTIDDLKQVNQQIADLEERRQALRHAQNKARATVAQQEPVLYGALIDGGAADKTLETITREKAREEAITQAEKQLNTQLAQLQTEREQIERDIAIAECEQTYADMMQRLYEFARLQEQAVAVLKGVQYPEVPRGYTLSKDAQLARNLLQRFHGYDLYRELIELERIAPDFVAEARKTKKGKSK